MSKHENHNSWNMYECICSMTDYEMIALRKEYERAAFRRGAEAIRKTAAEACQPMLRSMASRSELEGSISALPIPEYTDAP